jgi:formate dehydrogenase major subunit
MTSLPTPGTRISITVDGKPTEVWDGLTILQALRQEGIAVPNLCYDLRLSRANGNCGLCVVAVDEGTHGTRDVKSCQTPVRAGMVLITHSPQLDAYRKIRLEQLLADHNADCEAPCVQTCPAGIDIQTYLRQVVNGNHQAALRVIKDRNPFPSACGRVCPHPCETQCRRGLVDSPVAINHVKRFVADRDLFADESWLPRCNPASGKRIAVIGAGPAGLSAAYYSAIHGHAVTVFERLPHPGGMMRYGIPEYRLPKATLDREISVIQRLGVHIECGKSLGTQLRLEELARDYDAVFLAIGSWRPTPLQIEGESSPGVYLGITYLEKVTKGERINLGKTVVVIGGGNTAIDCARTALRQGARDVKLVYRRTRDEMPAEKIEIEEAVHEGVELVFLTAPTRISVEDGRTHLHCIRMALGEPDRSGRRRPVPVEGSDFTIAADTVIGAIGQSTNTQFLYNDLPVKLNKWGDVDIDGRAFTTSVAKVFAGGDCVTGPATVVQAVGAGRRAADAMHGFLIAGVVPQTREDYSCSRGSLEDLPRHEFEARPHLERAVPPAVPVAERLSDFREVDGALSEDAARAEAARCLKCGCTERNSCNLRSQASAHGVTFRTPLHQRPHLPIVEDHPFIIRDHTKCIACGRCMSACAEIEGVDVLAYRLEQGRQLVGTRDDKPLRETACVSCGQCVNACPCGALDYRRERGRVFRALNDPNKVVVGFVAPAVRAHLAAHFGIPADRITGFLAGLLRRIGFDRVFDVTFTADLTIMEEGTELLHRVGHGGALPLFTSCCPGWVNHVEHSHADLIPHLSSCRSPQQMLGSTVKHHFPGHSGIPREKLFVVSVMPCIAKKAEAARPEFATDGERDVDAVLTTTELLEMVHLARIDTADIVPAEFDEPYRRTSGAGVLFGNSGGVTEAALRMALEALAGPQTPTVEFHAVRGFQGVKEATLTAGGATLRVAVVSGLGNVGPLLDQVRRGESPYHLVEVMACPGGCINGAGHPVPEKVTTATDRKELLEELDRTATCRTSQANDDVQRLYRDFYGEPGSHRAHELLHTSYRARG